MSAAGMLQKRQQRSLFARDAYRITQRALLTLKVCHAYRSCWLVSWLSTSTQRAKLTAHFLAVLCCGLETDSR